MNRFLLPFFLLLFSTAVNAQSAIEKWVRENTHSINSVDPADTAFAELEVFGNAIGDARIIMLGEQDHGDAPAFLAKSRLVRYLHEKKGFTVLAFESDFVGLNYNWELIKQGRLHIDSIKRDIYPIWSACSATQYLFNTYVPACLRTNNPLHISGFDSQVKTFLPLSLLDSVMNKLALPIRHQADYTTRIYPMLQSWVRYSDSGDSLALDTILHYYGEIKKQLLGKLSDNDFAVMLTDNLITQTKQYRNWKGNYGRSANIRDRQMAINLQWLCRVKYPNEKIIIWAHNYHVSKYAGHYPQAFRNYFMTMGTVFTQDTSLLRQTYILGFTSYEGTAGRFTVKPFKVEKPKAGSFENWMNKNYQYAFVDFSKYNATQPGNEMFFMKGSIEGPPHRNIEGDWTKIFDGVFYIREMYPCPR